ncbi:predicted protein [Sclerotinia sclerotiorum 1980 UF-70]|uniref:Uncharacterized protein n=1 Tax=Sclerotinia sclerotiorum (strain ATCC 18683 / 1980 / Ss-1) TaxID=665079 RepID=A7E893_SCLS1|nr:predicted protein [Sclerotinia sclerotiorum 1980 UF-70]EDN96595.1 predicted protein [Sclerotinia sclerotiorum 1980 UF-70]
MTGTNDDDEICLINAGDIMVKFFAFGCFKHWEEMTARSGGYV